MGISQEGQAFLLVCAAGLCTAIGASVVFFPMLANLAKPNVLSIALSFAAGIMVYISMADIYAKSIDGFAESGFEDGDSFIYATLSFFFGCVLMLLLDYFVDLLLSWDTARKTNGSGNSKNNSPAASSVVEVQHNHGTLMGSTPEDASAVDEMRIKFETKIQSEQQQQQQQQESSTGSGGNRSNNNAAESIEIDESMFHKEKDDHEIVSAREEVKVNRHNSNSDPFSVPPSSSSVIDTTKGDEGRQLTHMSWAMAASIAIHNFPEGMVTYLAYLNDNAVGVALAIGIAVHNIPEGLCVSMPLYYSTGRRFYSFLCGTISGLTEPFGALIVFLILRQGLSGTANGILFGIVAGMMIVISIDELLPTAHKYTSNPKHVTWTFLFGMLFIASSLMLFNA